ncbi:kelch-like protein 2 [Glandiceps talaboti]
MDNLNLSHRKLSENGVCKLITNKTTPENLMDYTVGEIRNALQIQSCLRDQQLRGENCDITLSAEDEDFRAHSGVLTASSPYFEALLRSGMKETHDGRVELKCLDSKGLAMVLQYMYSGKVTLNSDNITYTLVAADLLLMTSLKHECEQFLIKHINTTDCLAVRLLSRKYQMPVLLEKADMFIQEHFLEIINGIEILSCSSDSLHEIMLGDRVNVMVENEAIMFELLLRWTYFDREEREDDFPVLFSAIRLPLMGRQYFLEKVENHELVRKFSSCWDYVLETLRCWVNPTRQTTLDPSLFKHRLGQMIDVVVLCGGRDSLNAVSKDVFAFVIRENTWARLPGLPVPMCLHSSVALGGKLYVGGSISSSLSDVFCYDPVKNIWSTLPPMHHPREHFTLVTCARKLYAVGGKQMNLPMSDFVGGTMATVERFCPEKSEWEMLPPMHNARSFANAVSLNNKYFYVTDNSTNHDEKAQQKNECYIVHEDTWLQLPRHPQCNGICPPPILNLDGEIYLTYLNGDDVKLGRYCDWRMVGNLPKLPVLGGGRNVCRHETAICSLDGGGMFVCGGWNDALPLGSIEQQRENSYIWKGGSNHWRKVPSPPMGEVNSAACCQMKIPLQRLQFLHVEDVEET